MYFRAFMPKIWGAAVSGAQRARAYRARNKG
jgi:hypothetical protein